MPPTDGAAATLAGTGASVSAYGFAPALGRASAAATTLETLLPLLLQLLGVYCRCCFMRTAQLGRRAMSVGVSPLYKPLKPSCFTMPAKPPTQHTQHAQHETIGKPEHSV